MEILIKTFTKRKYARSFIRSGEMLFRATDFFRAYEEKGDGRKDEWEGLITLPGLRQMLKEEGEVVDDNEPIGYFSMANLYCMTLIDSDKSISADTYSEISAFGKYSVVIFNISYFYNLINKVRLYSKKRRRNYPLLYSKVEYGNGDKAHIFRKAEKYSAQCELRIVSSGLDEKEQLIHIGRLHNAILTLSENISNIVGKIRRFEERQRT